MGDISKSLITGAIIGAGAWVVNAVIGGYLGGALGGFSIIAAVAVGYALVDTLDLN